MEKKYWRKFYLYLLYKKLYVHEPFVVSLMCMQKEMCNAMESMTQLTMGLIVWIYIVHKYLLGFTLAIEPNKYFQKIKKLLTNP